MTKQYDVFLSYSRTDSEVMLRVTDDLRKHGFSVWNDEALEPGTPSWKDALEAAIEGSQTIVALLSPDAKKSEWIERELDYARAQNVPIIPVIVRGETQSAVPFELITVQRVDLRKEYATGLSDLQEAIAVQLKRPDLRPAAQTRPIQQAQVGTDTSAAQMDAKPTKLARLHVWNPVSYGRLLRLYFFNPDELQNYDFVSRHRAAAWLASALIWLPILINVLTYRLSEVPIWEIEKINALLPVWVIPVGWLLTGLIGQFRLDVQVGFKALLRGPAWVLSIGMGISAALLYAGSLNFAQPPLSVHDGLAYLTTSWGQQVLIVAGGFSVFVGMIIANNLAQGFAGWVGVWASAGFIGLYALLFYLPLGVQLLPGLQSGGSIAKSDVTVSGVLSYAGVACGLGVVLWIVVGGIGAAQRKRNVSGFNFFVLAMLVGAYGLLIWGHSLG